MVRLDENSRDKIIDLLRNVPKINFPGVFFRYPMRKVGMKKKGALDWFNLFESQTYGVDEYSESVFEPVVSPSQNNVSKSKYGGDLNKKLTKFMKKMHKDRKSLDLDVYNHWLIDKGLSDFIIESFTCSHFVNAVLYAAFRNVSFFTDALCNSDLYGVSPAQMWREFRYSHGVWNNFNYEAKGIQTKGKLDPNLTDLYRNKLSNIDLAASFH